MFVTPLGITVVLQPCVSVFVAVSIIALQLLRLSYFILLLSTAIEVRLEQSENAPSPILVTLLGIVTEVRPVQPEKTLLPILVTLLGIVIAVNLLIP